MKTTKIKQRRNKDDVFEWIVKVADSCETPAQTRSLLNLILNYQKMYDLDIDTVFALVDLEFVTFKKTNNDEN